MLRLLIKKKNEVPDFSKSENKEISPKIDDKKFDMFDYGNNNFDDRKFEDKKINFEEKKDENIIKEEKKNLEKKKSKKINKEIEKKKSKKKRKGNRKKTRF